MLTTEPAQSPSVPLEGAPLWLNAILILAPIAAGVATVYLARGGKKIEEKPEDVPSSHPPPPPPPFAPPVAATSAPTSADEKLDVAERHMRLLEQIKEQQEAQIRSLNERVDWLVARDREKDETIRQLRMLVDRLAPPFPTRPQHWTPPPTV